MESIRVTSSYNIPAGTASEFIDVGIYVSSPTNYSSYTTILSVAGTIRVSSDDAEIIGAWGIYDQGGWPKQLIKIETGGEVYVTALKGRSHLTAYGYGQGLANSPSLVNQGLIDVQSNGRAFGIDSYGLDAVFSNSGTIKVVAKEEAYGIAVHNSFQGITNSGTIAVHGGLNAIGISVNYANGFVNLLGGIVRVTDDTPGAVNDRFSSYAAPGNSIAIDLESGLNRVQASPVRNFGLIEADIAVRFSPYFGFLQDIVDTHDFINESSGVVRGLILGNKSYDNVINRGYIEGDINLDAYNDTYEGSSGIVVGLVSGGDGNDRLVGGTSFDYLNGNKGNDTVTGSDGNDWLLGGQDADVISGGAGADLVYGNIGGDTLDGGEGDDIVRGGQDNDVLRGGPGNDFISGDKGSDTVSGGPGSDIFHAFGEAGEDRVTDFNRAEGDRVMLDPGSTYSVEQLGGDVIVNVGGGAQILLVGVSLSSLTLGWIFVG